MKTKIVDQEMCDVVRYLLEKRDSSMHDCARALGVSTTTVSKIKSVEYESVLYRVQADHVLKPLNRRNARKSKAFTGKINTLFSKYFGGLL